MTDRLRQFGKSDALSLLMAALVLPATEDSLNIP